MPALAQPLTAADGAALDRLLAAWPLPAAYARSHLRDRGFAPGGVRAYGCPSADGTLRAALVAQDRIAWTVWQTPDQAAALAACVPELRIDLLSGPAAQIAPLLAHLDGATPAAGDHCPFECLRPADLPSPSPGRARPARPAGPSDMERLIDFYLRGFYSLARLPTREAWRARLEEQLAHRTLFLIEEGGMVLSAALSSAETPAVAMLGGVATIPEERNRGLAAICVQALCTALFARGIGEIGLFYLQANASAARVYQKLGFRPAGQWWLQRVGDL